MTRRYDVTPHATLKAVIMADPFVPSDPALIEAVKRPLPAHTQDPLQIAAMERQADAMAAHAAAAAQIATALAATAGTGNTPLADNEVWLRCMESALCNPAFSGLGAASHAADDALVIYKQRFGAVAAVK